MYMYVEFVVYKYTVYMKNNYIYGTINGKKEEKANKHNYTHRLCRHWLSQPLPPPPSLPGRKTGKGCFVYSGRKGKSKSVNTEAVQLLEKYRMPVKGR